MEAPPHDRPLSERRLMVYERMLKDGAFRPVTWATTTCKETGGFYRVNGKHTSLLLAGLPDIPEFYVTIEEYECDTLEDVAKLYSTFDSRQQLRSANDIYHSFAGTVPELAVLPRHTITLAVAGIDIYKSDGVSGRSSGASAAERAERLLDYPEYVVWLNSVLLGDQTIPIGERHSSKHMYRASIAGAMLGSYLKAQADADKFWKAVRNETGNTPNVPDRKLARLLLTVGVHMGTGTRRVKVVGQRELYVKAIHAWNAWRRGESTDMKYLADKDIPPFK
jgi:hypothetical protein